MASNAFGAKIQVTETDSLKYGLAFEPDSWTFPEAHVWAGRLGGVRFFERTISMVPEKARLFLPNAQVILVCKLAQDQWALNSHGGKAATVSSPESTNIGKRYLHVKLEQIWVFDGSKGDVVVKFTDDRPRSPR